MTAGSPRIVKRFMQTVRSGWYIRVLTPGRAPVAGPVDIETADPVGITVHEAATAVYGDYDNTRRREIADHPALAASWRATLLHLASLES